MPTFPKKTTIQSGRLTLRSLAHHMLLRPPTAKDRRVENAFRGLSRVEALTALENPKKPSLEFALSGVDGGERVLRYVPLTWVDARARRDHDHVTVQGRRDKFLNDERTL